MIDRVLILSAALILPATATAATFTAKPATAITATRMVARDVSWTCGPAACQGSGDYGRPLVSCQALAKKAGRIEQFAVDGRPLSAADLDACNRVARAAPAPSMTGN